VKNTIRQEDLDLKLSALALNLEAYDAELAKLAAKYDAVDAELESRDPASWRKEPKSPSLFTDDAVAAREASAKRRAGTRALTIEEQFRTEVDRITIQPREEEADLARRIEFARLRFENALERAGIDPESMSGFRPGLPDDGGASEEGGIPLPVLKRWNELHLLRTELVERNLYLVLINVERYAHTRVSRMDLIQEGSAVLFRAADGFDWKRGLLFRTYAVHWLNQAFRSYLYNFGNTVRVPVYLQKAMKHVRDAMERMGDRSQDVKALAEATDLGENVVNSALRASRSTHSIDSVSPSSSGEGLSLRDTLTDDEPGGLYNPDMEDVGLEDGAEMALARLSERERFVIGLRFGLEGNKEHTLAEIADKMGVSLERIRQIQVRAISKMDTPRLRKAVAPFLAEGA
jgi:RNA polymerase sigma factor (sigma-70 family)